MARIVIQTLSINKGSRADPASMKTNQPRFFHGDGSPHLPNMFYDPQIFTAARGKGGVACIGVCAHGARSRSSAVG